MIMDASVYDPDSIVLFNFSRLNKFIWDLIVYAMLRPDWHVIVRLKRSPLFKVPSIEMYFDPK